MSNDITLNFNQLLDAVKIELLQQQIVQNQKQHQMFSKLGENYQDRLLIPKMRSIDSNTNNSTGSSRRSTPINSIFSNCSSSNSSSPNSPPSLLQIQTQCSAFVNTNNLTNQFSSDLLVNNQSVFNKLNLASNILEQQINKKPVILSSLIPETSSETISAATSNTQILTSSSSLQNSTSYSNTFHHGSPSSSTVSLSVRQSRAAHNELEKNRRANLRSYLDKLKTVLPPDSDSTRDTTLSLLTRARNYLRTVKQEKNTLLEKRKNALAELLHLRQELASLKEAEQNITVNSNTSLPIDKIENTKKNQTLKIKKNCSKSSSTFSVLSSTQLCEKKDISKEDINPINYIDLYMEGLLPALPLLYPYQEMTLRHSLSL